MNQTYKKKNEKSRCIILILRIHVDEMSHMLYGRVTHKQNSFQSKTTEKKTPSFPNENPVGTQTHTQPICTQCTHK